MGGGISLNGKSILDLTYPIGSLYISKENVSPASLFGGTWEQVAEGYTLWTTTTSGEGGKKISAGLPNITGSISAGIWADTETSASGAFSITTGGKHRPSAADSVNLRGFSFNANNGATTKGIYGNSNTVQPPAIKTYMWIRIS